MNTRKIAQLDLSSFRKPALPGNPTKLIRACWYVFNTVIFKSSMLGLLPSDAKARILRAFGANIAKNVVFKPRVDIKSPWFLEIGENVWIGEKVWIDNHTTVKIGANCCVSQGAYLFTGNHDWNDPSFAFFCKPIEIGDSVWITAFCRVGPGSIIPSSTAVLH